MTTLLHDPRRGLPSASSMARLEQCPGSLALIESLRRDALLFEPFDPDRDAGNRIHAYLAGAQIELVESELQTARKAAELRDALVNDWLGLPLPPNFPAGFERMVEQRLWFRRGILPVFSGQPDFVIVDHARNRGLIINYKTGRREAQPAADNLQLRTETVLLKHHVPALKEVEASICEPWTTWSPLRVKYDERALQEAQKEILAIVDRVLWESDNRTAGEWCFYCKARAHCQQARDYVSALYRLALKSKDAIAELPGGEHGAKVLRDIQTVSEILAALKMAYKERMRHEPDFVDGFYLHEGRADRALVNVPEARKRLRPILDDEEFEKCAKWSVAQLEEAVGKKKKLNGKALDKVFADLIGDIVEVNRGDNYIAEITQKERQRRRLVREARETITQ